MNCFDGFLKGMVTVLIGVLVGYIIFEVQKIDLIRAKKMDSFEIIVESFNEIAQKRYSSNSMGILNFITNAIIETQNKEYFIDSRNKEDEAISDINKSLMNLKLDKLKIDYIRSSKENEVEIESLIAKIEHNHNLLKIYYGYSLKNNILPISKMIEIIRLDTDLKKDIEIKILNLYEEIKPILIRKIQIKDIEEAKKIEEKIKSKIEDWIFKNENTIKTTKKLHKLFSRESEKLTDFIYNTYTKELYTPLFKIYSNINKEKSSQLVYLKNREIIKYHIVENKDGEFYFKEIN